MSNPERLELEKLLEGLGEAAELGKIAEESKEAADLLEMLARAIFPPELRGVRNLTWGEGQAHLEANTAVDPRVLAERRLKAAERRFQALVEQIPAVTFLAALGEGENEVYVSRHIETLLGYSQEDWLDNPFLWYHRLHPDDRALWNEEFARGCRSGGPFRAECRFLAQDGHTVWVHGEARIVKDELGRPMYLQGIAFDITESKRAQELLLDQAVRRAKFQEEMDIARRVQTTIVPKRFAIKTLEIAAAMVPAEEVGGDYYDVLPFEGGAWLGIGDVSGHGLDAGVVMLMLQSAVSALRLARPDAGPAELLSHANRVIYENVRTRLSHDDHVTFTLCRYQNDGQIKFAGAHEYILVYRRATQAVEAIRTPGTWLGVLPDVSRFSEESELELQPGDVMVLYTDGITEAMNATCEQFGLERFSEVVRLAGREPVEHIVDRVLIAAREWMVDQVDDMSLLVVRQR